MDGSGCFRFVVEKKNFKKVRIELEATVVFTHCSCVAAWVTDLLSVVVRDELASV